VSPAVTGSATGVFVWGAANVELRRLWIHDTTDFGLIVADRPPAATSAALLESLVEQVEEAGVVVRGAELTIDRSAIRDTQVPDGGDLGRGVNVQANPQVAKQRSSTSGRA
jgi:hypothetical protein